jgi:hypothetical protein
MIISRLMILAQGNYFILYCKHISSLQYLGLNVDIDTHL